MRETFQAELDALIGDMAAMARMAAQMMTNASTALHQGDLALAELVISRDDEMNALHDDMEHRCISLLALQAPVAADLRVVVAAMHAVGDLERMGNLAQHIGDLIADVAGAAGGMRRRADEATHARFDNHAHPISDCCNVAQA